MDKFSDLFEEWNDNFENRKELSADEESSLMHNSFLIITGRATHESLLGDSRLSGAFIGGIMATLFNPTEPDDDKEKAIDTLIEYYTKEEDYEKCAELVKLKNKK